MTTGIAVLGSTGSIGRQTLDVVRAHPERFRVVGLAAGAGGPQLEAQASAWPTAQVHARDGRPAWLPSSRWAASLEELAQADGADIVVVATTGMAALPAVLAALREGRRVALANKETLVTGGHLVEAELARRGGDALDHLDWLRPVDSEHSAIWQCLRGEALDGVARIILTASGGPFRERDLATLGAVTPAEALAHPTWQMGPKITIDSATLVNKAFEAIEARWLYRLPYSRIEAVIHPRSVVHSLVEFTDGSFKAQLGLPDMRLPIQFALTFPDRAPAPVDIAAPTAWGSIDFLPLDMERFPAYRVVRESILLGGNRGAILNAADEAAVAAFLDGRLAFDRIAATLEDAVTRWGSDDDPDLGTILALDAEIRATLSAPRTGPGR